MLYLGHCLIKMRFLIMNEDSFISPALTGDINERLEKRFADEAVRRQSFNEIENIAKILRIGKKFKVPQAELLYQLSDKSPLELYRIGRVCKNSPSLRKRSATMTTTKIFCAASSTIMSGNKCRLTGKGFWPTKLRKLFPRF